MSRRTKKSKQAVSLFPFLSILACVIGTLTLMITALALGQMDTDEVASLEKFELAKERLKQLQDAIERLKQQIAQWERTADEDRKELAELRIKLDELQREKERLLSGAPEESEEPDMDIPVVDKDAHEKRMAELAEELRRQEDRKKELLAELEKRGEPPKEAEVIIQPSGTGVDLQPHFVECAAGGIVIYEGGDPVRVRRADLATDEAFVGLLDRIANNPKARVVFLIRDDGLATYNAASAVATNHYARHGKLPVIGHGKIDLSLFQQ
jgi:hypothetical protein